MARHSGLSRPKVGRIERGEPRLAVADLFPFADCVGLDVSLRLYPSRDPARDAGHGRLLARLGVLVHPALPWRSEVPLPLVGDRRPWDATVGGPGWRFGIEAETRLEDAQALARKIALKARDGDVAGVILLIADTRRNRQLEAVVRATLGQEYVTEQREILRALASGQQPPGSGIVRL